MAPAGCGKTYEIVQAAKAAPSRRLILTHTHAGVDVLRGRLRSAAIPQDKYQVDTIAAWCLKYAASFPIRSGIQHLEPDDADWNEVYVAAERLLKSGAVNNVLTTSFGGVFVDEYQDCSLLQHRVISELGTRLPTCVFGDPLQAVFDFNQEPVDWPAHVYPTFPKIAELDTPWRWKNKGNDEMAAWLGRARSTLLSGGTLDLRDRPACVRWEKLPSGKGAEQSAVLGVCKRMLGAVREGEDLIVIGDRINLNARALLAQKLSACGFTNIEPLASKSLKAVARKIERQAGFPRLEQTMAFIEDCMTGCSRTKYLEAVRSHQRGRSLGVARYGERLLKAGVAVAETGSSMSIMALMQLFYEDKETTCFRRELFFSMRAALRQRERHPSLSDAVWHAQNQARHTERRIGRRAIGSTLLVKGLEFDHAVAVHDDRMSAKDWYVAITRASRTLTIVSPSQQILAVEAGNEPA